MTRISSLLIFSIIIAQFLQLVNSALSAQEIQNKSFKPDWIKTYDNNDTLITYETAFFLPKDGHLYVVVKSIDYSNIESLKSFLVLKINQDGDLVNTNKINIPDNKIYAVDYFELNNENNYILFVETENKLLFVKMSNRGEVLSSKEIMNYSYRSEFFKIKKIKNNDAYLIIGHIGFESLFLIVDKNGNILLKKELNLGNKNLLVDVFIDEKTNDFFVVGNSGNYESSFTGPSDVWFGKFNDSGEIIKSLKFPGRNGSVTKNKNGNYLLTFDKSNSIYSQIWVKTFDTDMNEITSALIYSNPKPDFNILNIIGLNVIQSQSLGYYFVGSKDLIVSVSLFNDKNELVSTYWKKDNKKSIGLDHIYITKDNFYIFSDILFRKELKEKINF